MRTMLCGSLLGLASSVLAQNTWIVNAGGGPGVHFMDLPTAVAAAAAGDTIVVQTGPANEGATPFTTDKGLTIVGEGGAVPITSSHANPFEVVDLPPGERFAMVGFVRQTPGELNFRITNCQGQVHLDRLRALEPADPFPTWPAFVIADSSHVTMQWVANHGAPAMQIDDSRVSLVWTQLGVTPGGLGGGPWIAADHATIDLVAPRMDTGFGAPAGITTNACDLTVTGIAYANMTSFPYLFNAAGDAIVATGGTVRVDPLVVFQHAPGAQAIAGSAVVTTEPITATATSGFGLVPGVFLIQTRVQPSATVWHAIGAPSGPMPSLLGTLWLDPTATYYVLGPLPLSPFGEFVQSVIFVPPGSPLVRGAAFTLQAIVFDGGALSLGLPCTSIVF